MASLVKKNVVSPEVTPCAGRGCQGRAVVLVDGKPLCCAQDLLILTVDLRNQPLTTK